MMTPETTAGRDLNAAMDGIIIPRLADATNEVFETMVFKTLVAGTPRRDERQPKANVVGAIRFLGSLSGTVSFYSSDAAAREIAGALLGISPEDAGNEVP